MSAQWLASNKTHLIIELSAKIEGPVVRDQWISITLGTGPRTNKPEFNKAEISGNELEASTQARFY